MGRIRMERKHHHPVRKQADFHLVFHYKRVYSTSWDEKQMNAGHRVCILLRLTQKSGKWVL